jgi:hypothetical protein
MTFANFSWPWVLGGLAVLAASLYALQILRIRYREVTVVSTFLWRKAMQELPVRKFRERFRHPWAYALSLAICSLIWLALAEPTPQQASDSSFHVLILDGSAGMAAGDRYEKAVDALQDRVKALPEARRQVLWSGAEVKSLLNPGENSLLLAQRLRGLKPEAAPASLEKLLGDLCAVHHGDSATDVMIFGDAPVHQALLDSTPKDCSIKRASAVEKMAHNVGITALGVSDAQSGQWDKVDVYLQAQSNDNTAVGPGNLQIDIDGKPVAATLQAQGENKGWLIRDVQAQGGLLTVKLLDDKDALALDNSAGIRLPSKPFINVQLSATLEASLKSVLQADPAVRLTDTNAQLVIRNAGENLGGTLPALEFVAASQQPQAFLLTYPANIDGEARFAEAVDSIGLKQIDAMALADTAQRPIEVSMKQGRQWQLSLWHELLTDDFNFTRSRAFPLFLANAVRWLAGVPAAYPYAAAGQPLSGDSIDSDVHVVDAKGRRVDPLGVAFVPEQAGAVTLEAGTKPLLASLLDSATTVGGGDESTLQVATSVSGGEAGANFWVTALLLLGLLLLAAEWYWHRNGRMP